MTGATDRRAPRRASTVVAAAGALISLLVLSGCVPVDPVTRPTPTGLASPVSVAPDSPLVVPDVIRYCPLEEAVHFTGYWLPTDEVYICRADGRKNTDGVLSYGPWESASRIDKPAALLRAYRASNARARVGNCTPEFHDPLIVWVHRDGVTSAYYAPVNACGLPTAAAIHAYDTAKRTVLIDIDRGAPPSSQKDANG